MSSWVVLTDISVPDLRHNRVCVNRWKWVAWIMKADSNMNRFFYIWGNWLFVWKRNRSSPTSGSSSDLELWVVSTEQTFRPKRWVPASTANMLWAAPSVALLDKLLPFWLDSSYSFARGEDHVLMMLGSLTCFAHCIDVCSHSLLSQPGPHQGIIMQRHYLRQSSRKSSNPFLLYP